MNIYIKAWLLHGINFYVIVFCYFFECKTQTLFIFLWPFSSASQYLSVLLQGLGCVYISDAISRFQRPKTKLGQGLRPVGRVTYSSNILYFFILSREDKLFYIVVWGMFLFPMTPSGFKTKKNTIKIKLAQYYFLCFKNTALLLSKELK